MLATSIRTPAKYLSFLLFHFHWDSENVCAGGWSGGLPGGVFSLAFKAALLRFTEADTEFAEFRWRGPKAESTFSDCQVVTQCGHSVWTISLDLPHKNERIIFPAGGRVSTTTDSGHVWTRTLEKGQLIFIKAKGGNKKPYALFITLNVTFLLYFILPPGGDRC